MLSHPIITSLIWVPHEFLQCMVERQDEVITHLTQMEIQLTALYRQIWPWFWTILDTAKARFKARIQVKIAEHIREIHDQIDSYEARMTARLPPPPQDEPRDAQMGASMIQMPRASWDVFIPLFYIIVMHQGQCIGFSLGGVIPQSRTFLAMFFSRQQRYLSRTSMFRLFCFCVVYVLCPICIQLLIRNLRAVDIFCLFLSVLKMIPL